MDWIHVVQQLGFPTVVCGALMLGIWRTGKWLIKTVVEPLLGSHLAFIEKTSEAIEKILELQQAADAERRSFHAKLDEALGRFAGNKGTTN
jgi:hypothetical protein